MRIKFNDKIYRLKEIESGVDSLMELVEESKHKHGDFLMTDNRIAFILDREGVDGEAYHLFCTDMDGEIRSHMQDRKEGVRYCGYLKHAVLADSEATEAIHYGLKSIGKRWNAEKKRIEDIPVYNDGDFVAGIGCIFILHTQINKYSAQYHVLYEKTNGMLHYGKTYSQLCGTDMLRLATETEKQELLDALAKEGKWWNTEKKCIEDVPVYKDGDFVVNDLDAILIFKEADGDRISDHAYLPVYGELVIDRVVSCKGIKRYATTEEKQRIIDALAERGKWWNKDKKCIENVTVYKKGDILVKEYTENKKFIFILSRIDEDGLMYCDCHYSTLLNKTEVMYDVQVCSIWNNYLRRAEESEKKLLINELIKIGKQWNDDKKYIEDILKRKFKAGDKVRIKDGISSKTHREVAPSFVSTMDEFIGKELTVEEYNNIGWIVFYEDDYGYQFDEDWLEPWSDEPKVGDWVIFWDHIEVARIGMLTDIRPDELEKYVVDHLIGWNHAVKWDGTIEHLEKIRKG